MKILITVAALLILSACYVSISKSEGALAQTNLGMPSSTANNSSSTLNDAPGGKSGSGAQDERFKTAPGNFKKVDFSNHSYPYKFSYGRKVNIALKNGEYEYDIEDDRGWFNLKDVYYSDVTGDGIPEAIVILWHVSCGASCDGGAGLFYVYSAHQNNLKPIWQYETGSLAYGCGLKSFTARSSEITMELFGRCFGEAEETLGVLKFHAKDTTHLTFVFDGRKFVEGKKEILTAPERSVLNYQPEISINE